MSKNYNATLWLKVYEAEHTAESGYDIIWADSGTANGKLGYKMIAMLTGTIPVLQPGVVTNDASAGNISSVTIDYTDPALPILNFNIPVAAEWLWNPVTVEDADVAPSLVVDTSTRTMTPHLP